MNCPECEGETRVVHTDKYERYVLRVRKCTECGNIETTEEIPKPKKSTCRNSTDTAI